MRLPIPEVFPFPSKGQWDFRDFNDTMAQFKVKDEWNNRGMYAFVCWQWVYPLAKWIGKRKALEIMAGAGWLARALRDKGTEILATDDYSWIDKRGWEPQTTIERMDATEAVEKYGPTSDLLIISWPYMDSEAFYALRKWEKAQPGAPVIYIGEPEGGCTANEEFFNHFEEIDNDWHLFPGRPSFEPVRSNYQTWWGLHDRIMLGKYKP